MEDLAKKKGSGQQKFFILRVRKTNYSVSDGFVLRALFSGVFLSSAVGVFLSTLLVDISKSLKISLGTATQLGLISSVVSLATGLAMGLLTIRFQHKSLFIFGIAIFTFGALGFYFARSFAEVLVSQFFIGISVTIIGIMAYALCGELFTLEKRGAAVGFVVSAGMVAYVIVAPLSGFISSIAGWKAVLLWFIIPFSVACLALCYLVIPSKQPQLQEPSKSFRKEPFKQILLNKSAMACVIGTLLLAILGTVPYYAVSFYRITFTVSPMVGGVFSAVAAVGGFFGGISAGRLINKYGRRPLTVATALVAGIFVILFTYVPNMLLSVAFWAVAATANSMAVSALFSLILEQVPNFKASMMSINSVFLNIGSILGLITGGLLLNLYHNDFQVLMTVFGLLGAATAPLVLLFAKDPCKADPNQE